MRFCTTDTLHASLHHVFHRSIRFRRLSSVTGPAHPLICGSILLVCIYATLSVKPSGCADRLGAAERSFAGMIWWKDRIDAERAALVFHLLFRNPPGICKLTSTCDMPSRARRTTLTSSHCFFITCSLKSFMPLPVQSNCSASLTRAWSLRRAHGLPRMYLGRSPRASRSGRSASAGRSGVADFGELGRRVVLLFAATGHELIPFSC